MKTKDLIILPILIIFSHACVSSEYTTENDNKKEDEIYVFDDVSKVDTTIIQKELKPIKNEKQKEISEEVKTNEKLKYTVQVGAFSTKERADFFISQNQSKTSFPLKVVFIEEKKLYSVQIPPYSTKEEADKIRDVLKNFPPFKDAFTLPIEAK